MDWKKYDESDFNFYSVRISDSQEYRNDDFEKLLSTLYVEEKLIVYAARENWSLSNLRRMLKVTQLRDGLSFAFTRDNSLHLEIGINSNYSLILNVWDCFEQVSIMPTTIDVESNGKAIGDLLACRKSWKEILSIRKGVFCLSLSKKM